MLITIPKCPICKTQKNVVFRIAEVKKDKTWFHLCYCLKCLEVIRCYFARKLRTKKKARTKRKVITKDWIKKLQEDPNFKKEIKAFVKASKRVYKLK